MAKRTEGRNVQIVSKDETGASIGFDYTCPYCNEDNYIVTLTAAGTSDILSGDFEVDQTCEECGKAVIVECRQ